MAMELDIFRELTDDEINAQMEILAKKFAGIGLKLTWMVDETRLNDWYVNIIDIRKDDDDVRLHHIGRSHINKMSCFMRLEVPYHRWANAMPEADFNNQLNDLMRRMVRFGYRLADDAEESYRDGKGLPIICPDGSTFSLFTTEKSLRELKTRINRSETTQLLETYIEKYDPTADIIIREDCFFCKGRRHALRMEVLMKECPSIYTTAVQMLAK